MLSELRVVKFKRDFFEKQCNVHRHIIHASRGSKSIELAKFDDRSFIASLLKVVVGNDRGGYAELSRLNLKKIRRHIIRNPSSNWLSRNTPGYSDDMKTALDLANRLLHQTDFSTETLSCSFN